MNSLSTSVIILLSEINLLFLVAAGIATAMYVGRRQRDNDALNGLAAKLKQQYQARVEATRQRLGGAQDETAQRLVQAEYGFYKRFMDIYARRDSAAVKDLDAAAADVITSYQDLAAGTGGDSAAGGDAQQLQATVEALQAENQRLQEELDRTRQDMDATLNEYASAFEDDNTAPADASAEAADTGSADETGAAPDGTGEAAAAGTDDSAGEPAETGNDMEDTAPAAESETGGDNNDYDDELESLNLDNIDLGLDEQTRNTG